MLGDKFLWIGEWKKSVYKVTVMELVLHSINSECLAIEILQKEI